MLLEPMWNLKFFHVGMKPKWNVGICGYEKEVVLLLR